eukprot:scaffold7092_cov262-Pinguiococcus_pyrenoidosus.AAC.33
MHTKAKDFGPGMDRVCHTLELFLEESSSAAAGGGFKSPFATSASMPEDSVDRKSRRRKLLEAMNAFVGSSEVEVVATENQGELKHLPRKTIANRALLHSDHALLHQDCIKRINALDGGSISRASGASATQPQVYRTSACLKASRRAIAKLSVSVKDEEYAGARPYHTTIPSGRSRTTLASTSSTSLPNIPAASAQRRCALKASALRRRITRSPGRLAR